MGMQSWMKVLKPDFWFTSSIRSYRWKCDFDYQVHCSKALASSPKFKSGWSFRQIFFLIVWLLISKCGLWVLIGHWTRAHMNVTTFTRFAQNCIYRDPPCMAHCTIALALIPIPALQCCTLKSLLILNPAVLRGDIRHWTWTEVKKNVAFRTAPQTLQIHWPHLPMPCAGANSTVHMQAQSQKGKGCWVI